jgi:hypothetical protein
MADALYLNLWFPSFSAPEMMPHVLSVLRQFPFSAQRPGITAVSVYPLSWSEAPVLAQSFAEHADPEHAVALAGEFLHDDYGYEFQAYWNLWVARPDQSQDQPQHAWTLQPQRVRFIVNGTGFEEGVYQQDGHVQVDLGVDQPFLHEEETLTGETELRVRANVQKLVAFTTAVEKNCGISGRVLWSESEENLAQKLIARLQKVQ